MKFSTYDVDNDNHIDINANCASYYSGGWWYYYNFCHVNTFYYCYFILF